MESRRPAREHAVVSQSVAQTELAGTLFDEAFLKKLEILYIVSKKVFVGRLRADRRSRRLGTGQEFADVREYSPGDDFRYVDWNIYARMGRLVLRLFEEQEDLMVYLLLDSSTSMRTPGVSKFDYARRVSAALAYIALANLDRVALVPFSVEAQSALSSSRGKGQIFRVLEFLTGLDASGPTDMTASARRFVQEYTRTGLVVLISDFFAPGGYQDAVKLLRYNGHEVFAVQICDVRDARPDMTGDLRLVDAETGLTRSATVTRNVLVEYGREFDRYCMDLERFCMAQQTGCIRTLTDVPFEELILEAFRRGRFLH